MDDDAPKGAPAWVVTFGDMMSLLLCFFVLLLSFSTMEVEKFKVVAGLMRQAFGVQREHQFTNVPKGTSVVADSFVEGYTRVRIFEQVSAIIESEEMSEQVEAELEDDGVRIRMKGAAVFPSGDSSVLEAMKPFLDEVATLAGERPGTVIVEGHTDNIPIRTARFPSNWELSSARAGAVVRHLTASGSLPAERASAVGLADTRPLDDNATPEGRSKNRRVEIFIQESR